jgi:hypothetical protein
MRSTSWCQAETIRCVSNCSEKHLIISQPLLCTLNYLEIDAVFIRCNLFCAENVLRNWIHPVLVCVRFTYWLPTFSKVSERSMILKLSLGSTLLLAQYPLTLNFTTTSSTRLQGTDASSEGVQRDLLPLIEGKRRDVARSCAHVAWFCWHHTHDMTPSS